MPSFPRVRRAAKSFFRVKLGKSVAKRHTFEIGPEGANGTGKTSLLDVFPLVASSAQGPLNETRKIQ